MKGYLIFGFDNHERSGGAGDLVTMFENIEEIDLRGCYFYYDKIQFLDIYSGKLKSCNFKNITKEHEEKHGNIEKEDTYHDLLINFVKECLK